MSGLDNVDISILRILQEDAALTNKQIAARVHLSPTPVFERIKRLREQGYIKGYVAVLDTEKLEMDEVGECYNISGDYDFLLKIYVSSMKEYQQFVLRILGELDCIGGLNSCFVMGEVKNTHAVPVR